MKRNLLYKWGKDVAIQHIVSALCAVSCNVPQRPHRLHRNTRPWGNETDRQTYNEKDKKTDTRSLIYFCNTANLNAYSRFLCESRLVSNHWDRWPKISGNMPYETHLKGDWSRFRGPSSPRVHVCELSVVVLWCPPTPQKHSGNTINISVCTVFPGRTLNPLHLRPG